MPKFSIVIPTYNQLEDCLKPCLESIIKNTDLDNIEVIVVANDCTEEEKNYVTTLGHPFKLLGYEYTLSYPEAYNEGIKHSSGNYILLLSENMFFTANSINDKKWNDYLIDMFVDTNNKIIGPIACNFFTSNRYYLSFSCAIIAREVIDNVGLIDNSFNFGGFEDTDYCYRSENAGYGVHQVDFPIIASNPYGKIINNTEFIANKKNIRDKYIFNNVDHKKSYLTNYYERDFGSRDIKPNSFVVSRYEWAKENLVGNKILELGCSMGYGSQFFSHIENLDYLGIDYNEDVIDFAKEQFGDIPGVRFQHTDINDFELGYYDTIIAMEFIEHIDNGIEMAQTLKKHCNKLLITVPYNNDCADNIFHKLDHLTVNNFNGFECDVVDNAPYNYPGHMLNLIWQKPKSKTSIIIPTYNHLEDCLKPCLESIIANTDLEDIEVIVVANGCTDGTKEYVESLGDSFKLLWFDEPLGY